ncbi:MAG: purine-nucleoside phosphorylase [Bacteroidales bacterium]|nr:purine-nucleoside phosphorylase [Bacteroidales bacterium]
MDYTKISEAATFIKSKLNSVPSVAVVLGSGLGPLASEIENPVIISYKEIPHFPLSTVKGHAGNLIFGQINSVNVLCMQGRFHYYEGYSMEEVTFPERVFALLGIKYLIVTNAAGGVNKNFKCGDIMLITDHINFMPNPLIGRNDERFGERFPSMNAAYSKNLRLSALNKAEKLNIQLQQGVYLAGTGPSFETPAEYIMYRQWGASAVGMSTVPEVIVAVHCGMEVLGLSVISNVFNEDIDAVQTHTEVLDNVSVATNKTVALVKAIIADL